jgi:hypothetical protein
MNLEQRQEALTSREDFERLPSIEEETTGDV